MDMRFICDDTIIVWTRLAFYDQTHTINDHASEIGEDNQNMQLVGQVLFPDSVGYTVTVWKCKAHMRIKRQKNGTIWDQGFFNGKVFPIATVVIDRRATGHNDVSDYWK